LDAEPIAESADRGGADPVAEAEQLAAMRW
jgi:hypothetical protein